MERSFQRALAKVVSIARDLDLPILLVGAFARDLCLPAHARTRPRGTRDTDVAIVVASLLELDRFFERCAVFFEVRRADLQLRDLETDVRVDVLPCGEIEAPPGRLVLHQGLRVLNVMGLQEAFQTARRIELAEVTILVPSPAAFVLLKLLSYADRRARRDLLDLAHVLHRLKVDEEALYSDPMLMDGISDGTLVYEDAVFWQLGREIGSHFPIIVVDEVRSVLEQLLAEPVAVRVLLLDRPGVEDIDAALQSVDRMLQVLQRACAGGSGTSGPPA